MPRKPFWKFLISGIILVILASSAGHSSAQGAGVRPLRLTTGDVVPQSIPPDEVVVSPTELFDGKYFRIIQFYELPTYEMRQRWEGQGLYLVDYLPDDAYFAVIDQQLPI